MSLLETSIPPKEDVKAPAPSGGWWSPFLPREHTALGLMNVGIPVPLPVTSNEHYESAPSSVAVIWTVFS